MQYPYFGKICGGGASWYYLFNADGKLIASCHEDNKEKMSALYKQYQEMNSGR